MKKSSKKSTRKTTRKITRKSISLSVNKLRKELLAIQARGRQKNLNNLHLDNMQLAILLTGDIKYNKTKNRKNPNNYEDKDFKIGDKFLYKYMIVSGRGGGGFDILAAPEYAPRIVEIINIWQDNIVPDRIYVTYEDVESKRPIMEDKKYFKQKIIRKII